MDNVSIKRESKVPREYIRTIQKLTKGFVVIVSTHNDRLSPNYDLFCSKGSLWNLYHRGTISRYKTKKLFEKVKIPVFSR